MTKTMMIDVGYFRMHHRNEKLVKKAKERRKWKLRCIVHTHVSVWFVLQKLKQMRRQRCWCMATTARWNSTLHVKDFIHELKYSPNMSSAQNPWTCALCWTHISLFHLAIKTIIKIFMCGWRTSIKQEGNLCEKILWRWKNCSTNIQNICGEISESWMKQNVGSCNW